jgi:hypothetical protein
MLPPKKSKAMKATFHPYKNLTVLVDTICKKDLEKFIINNKLQPNTEERQKRKV